MKIAGRGFRGILAGSIAILIAGAAVAQTQTQRGSGIAQPQLPAERGAPQQNIREPIKVDADRLAAAPEQYYGRRVQVSGRIHYLLGDQSFTLEKGKRELYPNVVVLLPEPAPNLRGKQQAVTVTGRVQRFIEAEFRRNYNWFDSNMDKFKFMTEMAASPIIIAESVESGGKVIWQRKSSQEARSGQGQQTMPEVQQEP